MGNTVDGRNPAPVGMVNVPLFIYRVSYMLGGAEFVHPMDPSWQYIFTNLNSENSTNNQRNSIYKTHHVLEVKSTIKIIGPNFGWLRFPTLKKKST